MNEILYHLKIKLLGIRGSSLYLLQTPLWLALPVSLFSGQVFRSLILAVVICCFCYAAVLTRSYFLARQQQLIDRCDELTIKDERHIAMGLVSLGVFILCTFVTRRFMLIGIIAAALAALGYYLNYLYAPNNTSKHYPQPADHNNSSTDNHLSPTLRNILHDAYGYLEHIQRATERLSQIAEDQHIKQRLQEILHNSRILINEISKHDNRIRDARTFLVIHLRELADISDTYSHSTPEHKQQSRQQFSRLLDTIHTQLSAHYHSLSAGEQQRLNIQINVLQEQLERQQRK